MSDLVPVDRHALALKHEDVSKALAKLRDIPCTSKDAREFFDSVLSKAHTQSQDLVKERQALTKPDKDRIEETEAPFRPVLKALDALKALAKSKVSEFDTAVVLEVERLRALAVSAAQDDRTEDCAVALDAIREKEVPSSFEWQCDIVDARLVPREFLEISPALVRKRCTEFKSSDTIPEVPGLAFRRVAVVRAKR